MSGRGFAILRHEGDLFGVLNVGNRGGGLVGVGRWGRDKILGKGLPLSVSREVPV